MGFGWVWGWVDLGLGLGLRRGCRVVWFRVGCCERCGGVDTRGERGSLGPKLQGSHGTGQHPQHCRGSGGTIPLGGGVRGPGTGTYIHICLYTKGISFSTQHMSTTIVAEGLLSLPSLEPGFRVGRFRILVLPNILDTPKPSPKPPGTPNSP